MPRKLDEISSGARQNVIAGLYSFLEVLVRLQKLDLGLEICEYVSHCAPNNFQPQFKKKEQWFHSIQYQNNSQAKKNTHKSNNELGDLGLKLKEAMKKKN